MKYYKDFKYVDLQYICQRGTRYRPRRKIYEPSFYDSETSHYNMGDEENENWLTWVYLWGISVGDEIYYGRRPSEFIEFIETLVKAYNLDENTRLTIYVHNLPYDISYLYDYIMCNIDAEPKILASAPQKPFDFELKNGITFKCTYRLSQRSLEKWGNDLNILHKKKTDIGKKYDVVINQTEPLDDVELTYFEYDILALKECFYKEIEKRGYTYANVPLTKTGFVRERFKKEFKKRVNNRRFFLQTKPTVDQYERLIDASFGGITGVSADIIGTTVHHDAGIGHNDFDSHYPTQMEVNKMPMKPHTIYDRYKNIGKYPTKNLLKWYREHGYYYVISIAIKSLQVKKGVTLPFLSRSKLHLIKDKSIKIHDINGKVIKIEGWYILTCTNFDFEIYLEQYDMRYSVLAVDVYTTRTLPDYVLNIVKSLYADKTNFKNHVSELENQNATKEDILNAKQDLQLCKGDLNGIFGCSYTRIVRDELKIDIDTHKWKTTKADIQTAIDIYYNKWTSCLAYQWGVFTCALARKEIYDVLNVIGYDAFLYADTDSTFYKWSPEIEKRITDYNERCLADSIKKGYYVVLSSGDKKYFHKFDVEHDSRKSKTFRCLHSKCYALEPDGKLSITVAGVTKHYRHDKNKYREDELKNIENLKEDFTFKECGGTRAVYSYVKPGIYDTPYGAVETAGGCVILDTEKTLHDADADDLFIEYYRSE